ncbi:MAG: hypothetical protein ACPGSK_06035, partial [Alphaproteobacteria bacterium]
PRSLGAKESGGKSASPIFAAFINGALADTPVTQFRYPVGVPISNIDPRTGVIDVRMVADDGRVIGEGEEPREAVSGSRGSRGSRQSGGSASGNSTTSGSRSGGNAVSEADAIF